MPTIFDKHGNASFDYSLSKRERDFTFRLLNIQINSDVHDDVLIEHLSNNKNLLLNRHGCGPLSPLRHHEGLITPPDMIIQAVKNECINESNFSWVDTNNDRLCNYAWSFIRSIDQFPITASANMDIGISINSSTPTFNFIAPLYSQFHLETLPRNNTSKKHCIIAFFDMINITHDQKINGVTFLKEKWESVSKKMDVKSWVEKIDTEWAWNYLFANQKTGNNMPPIWFINGDKSSTIKDCIITLFDLLNETPPTRELILIKMKSAWSQKAYRDKNNGKKSVNVVLQEKIINMLDIICLKTGKRKNEVIAQLIKNEHDILSK